MIQNAFVILPVFMNLMDRKHLNMVSIIIRERDLQPSLLLFLQKLLAWLEVEKSDINLTFIVFFAYILYIVFMVALNKFK